MLRDVYDVKNVRVRVERMSDLMLVFCNLKIVGGWLIRGRVDNIEGRVRSERLSSQKEVKEYIQILVSNDEELRMK